MFLANIQIECNDSIDPDLLLLGEDEALLFSPADRDMFRRIWVLTWPMIAYNFLELTVGLVDLFMVRSFGASGTAAVGVGRQLTLVSQATGSGSRATVQAAVSQALVLVVLLSIPTTLIGIWLSRPMLVWLQAGEAELAQGVPYLRIYFAGITLLWCNVVGVAIFRGSGDPWTPLKLAACVSVLNVGLNYLFIFGWGGVPSFGVPGAALGTVAARGVMVLVMLYLLFWRETHLPPADEDERPAARWFDGQAALRMLRIGVPMALANVARHGSRLVFLAIAGSTSLGLTFHAALGVGFQLRLVGIVPALAFQSATAALVGQMIGRGNVPEADAVGRRSVQLLSLLMLLIVLVPFVLAEPIARVFIADPHVAQLGALVLRAFAVAQYFSALSIGIQGALLGAGDTKPALRYTILCDWCLLLTTSYLVAGYTSWAPSGLLIAWMMAPMVTLLLMWRRWKSGLWKLRKV